MSKSKLITIFLVQNKQLNFQISHCALIANLPLIDVNSTYQMIALSSSHSDAIFGAVATVIMVFCFQHSQNDLL